MYFLMPLTLTYTESHKMITTFYFSFFQLLDVANLGVPVEKGQPSTLAVKLHELVKEDCYKAYSVLRLLDMAVGDVIYSESMNKVSYYFSYQRLVTFL